MSANAIETLRGWVHGEFCTDEDCLGCGRVSGHSAEADPEPALAAVEALLEAANATLGYQPDLNPVWQLGAGQDWTEWTEAKDRLRAAVRRVETGQ